MNRNFLSIGVMQVETSGQQRQTCGTLGSRRLHELAKSCFGNITVLWANQPQVQHVQPHFGSRATDLVLQIPQASGDEETMSCCYYSAAMVRKCSPCTAFYGLLSVSLKLQQVGVCV